MSATNPTNRTPYTCIDELANTMEALAISDMRGSANKMLKIANITFKGHPLSFKPDDWVRILYEPSVYNGTGDEERKNIVFEISPEIEHALATLEETIRQSMDEKVSNINSIWCSVIKPATDFHGPTAKAKIKVSGEQVCRFYDENNAATEPPSAFKSLDAKVVLRIQGVYIQKQAAGLLMSVTHMQTRPATAAIEDLTSPF